MGWPYANKEEKDRSYLEKDQNAIQVNLFVLFLVLTQPY